MSMVPVIYIYGTSDSGKTRLVERLLEALGGAGRAVGTVKCSAADALDVDTEGKDTHRHVMAGATATAATSLSNAALFIPRRLGWRDLVEIVSATGDVDLIIIEGLGDDVPDGVSKIAVGEVKGRVPGTIMELPDPEGELGGALHLLDRVMTTAKQSQEGEVKRVSLKVGGKDVQIKDFVQDFLEGTVRGAVGALHDSGAPGDAIELRLPQRRPEG